MCDRNAQLNAACELLTLFGVANDAEDHNCGEEAEQLRARAVSGLRQLLSEAPYLSELLPTLSLDLQRPEMLSFRWATHVQAIERSGSQLPRD
jgi:hypothetical protein